MTCVFKHVKKKRGLFSVPIPPCRSLVCVAAPSPTVRRFGILTKFPFVVCCFYEKEKTNFKEHLPST